MEQLNLSFWLGIAAAIPLSIFANLITPRLQQWAATRSAAKSSERSRLLQEELRSVEELTEDRLRLHTFLLESVLLITLLTSMFGVIAGALFALASFFPVTAHFFASLGQLIAVGGGVAVMRECIDVLRKSRRARNIERYRSQVAIQLEELGIEAPNPSVDHVER